MYNSEHRDSVKFSTGTPSSRVRIVFAGFVWDFRDRHSGLEKRNNNTSKVFSLFVHVCS